MVVPQSHNTEGGGGGSDKQTARTRATSSGAEQEMKKAVNSLVRKNKVQAYVVLALSQDNEITVTTSRGIQHTVQPLMREWASSHLRRAHEFSGFVEETVDEKPNVVHSPPESSEASPIDEAMAFTPSPTSDYARRYQKILKDLIADGSRAWNPPPAFQIDDTVNVTKTLLLCFLRLLQNMCKRLAKEWIKGICPRKQAKFPYRDSARERNGDTVEVPVWWPSEKLSTFREPDHVERMPRIAMCVHFLRLRPTVAQMMEWNSNATKKQPLKTHAEGFWTEFLKELAPVDIVDQVASANEGSKSQHWRVLLEKVYEIAAMEERYQNDEIDGSTMVAGLDGMKKSSRRGKRARRAPAAPASDDEVSSESDANVGGGPAVKKAKTTAGRAKADSKVKHLPTAQEEIQVASPPVVDDRKPVFQGGDRAGHIAGHLGPAMRSMSLPLASAAPTPLNTSFDSSLSDISAGDYPVFTPASPYSDLGGGYPQHGLVHMPNGIQCHNAHDIPQPQFATMPNTPTIAPNEMMPFAQHPALGTDMAGLSIDQPMPSPHFAAPPPVHPHHGLPTSRPQFPPPPQWADPSIPQPLRYQVQHGVPSAYTQHAGFAVGAPTTYHPATYHPPFHAEHDMLGHDDGPLVFGPGREIPPGALPASVERGYTGHSSGVGDSACPPGFAAPWFN